MRVATIFFAMLALVSCGSNGAGEKPSRLEGIVTDVAIVDNVVESFQLETDGETHTIVVDADRDYGFDLFHLEEHAHTGDPVVVELTSEGSQLVAIAIEDA